MSGKKPMELPPGFRFHPTDEEVIVNYLTEKVLDRSFSPRAIGEVDLNKCEPWDLPSKAVMGEKEWYFYCHKDRKYPTGTRTNRATESGYWKATGKDKIIYKGEGTNQLIGMKKTLVFYEGRAPKGRKTNWVMHEFRLEGKSSQHLPKAEREEWVVCRVTLKSTEALIQKSTAYSIPPSMEQPFHPDDHLFDASTLPPLMDSPIPKPRSLPPNTGGDLLGVSSTMPMGMNHRQRDPNVATFGINHPLHPYSTTTFAPNFHYCRPHQYCPNPSPSAPSTPAPLNKFCLHHDSRSSTGLAGGSTRQDAAPDPLGRPRQCKEEQYSNQSSLTFSPAICNDGSSTGISQDLATARSFDDIEHLLPSLGSLTDMESYLKF